MHFVDFYKIILIAFSILWYLLDVNVYLKQYQKALAASCIRAKISKTLIQKKLNRIALHSTVPAGCFVEAFENMPEYRSLDKVDKDNVGMEKTNKQKEKK